MRKIHIMNIKIHQRLKHHASNLNWIYLIVICLGLMACQPKTEDNQATEIERLQSKSVTLKAKQPIVCDEQQCIEYHFKTVKTNVAWIDTYFKQRIKNTVPVAFEQRVQPVKPSLLKRKPLKSHINIRFISQHGKFVAFEMLLNTESSSKRSELYHREYVNLDLVDKKRIAIEDIIQPNQQIALVDALYQRHQKWFKQHRISREQLKLTDNFYYGSKGVVFVYPVGELIKQPKEMPEFHLPYSGIEQWVKDAYIPRSP